MFALFAFAFTQAHAYRVRRQDSSVTAEEQSKTQELLKKVEQLGGQLSNKMKEYVDSGANNVANAAEQAQKALKDAADNLKTSGGKNFEAAKVNAQNAIKSATDAIREFGSNIKEKVNSMSSSASSGVQSSGVQSAAASATDAVNDKN